MHPVLALLLIAPLTATPTTRCTSEDVKSLFEGLSDADEDVRALSAFMLGDCLAERPRLTAKLSSVLRDEDEAWRVRAAAAGALGLARSEDVRARQALTVAVEEEDLDWRVRLAALRGAFTLDGGRDLAGDLDRRGHCVEISTPDAVLQVCGPSRQAEDRASLLREL